MDMSAVFALALALVALGSFLFGVGFACERLRGGRSARSNWRRVMGLSQDLGGPNDPDIPH